MAAGIAETARHEVDCRPGRRSGQEAGQAWPLQEEGDLSLCRPQPPDVDETHSGLKRDRLPKDVDTCAARIVFGFKNEVSTKP